MRYIAPSSATFVDFILRPECLQALWCIKPGSSRQRQIQPSALLQGPRRSGSVGRNVHSQSGSDLQARSRLKRSNKLATIDDPAHQDLFAHPRARCSHPACYVIRATAQLCTALIVIWTWALCGHSSDVRIEHRCGHRCSSMTTQHPRSTSSGILQRLATEEASKLRVPDGSASSSARPRPKSEAIRRVSSSKA